MMITTMMRRRQCCTPRWRKLFVLALSFCILHCSLVIESAGAQEVNEEEIISAALKEEPQEKEEYEVHEDTPEASSTPSSLIVEKDYLDSLSTAALEKICLDRGFAVAEQVNGNGTAIPLTREDYLEAAKRCITLEDEINMILHEHPELAAELETEVERMRQHKERLEAERDELQAELRLLQAQLDNSGVDLTGGSGGNSDTEKAPENMTLEQVLRETFTELIARVHRDLKIVWGLVRPVLEPVLPTLQKFWKSYGKPLVKQLWKLVRKIARKGVEEYKKRTQSSDESEAASLSAIPR